MLKLSKSKYLILLLFVSLTQNFFGSSWRKFGSDFRQRFSEQARQWRQSASQTIQRYTRPLSYARQQPTKISSIAAGSVVQEDTPRTDTPFVPGSEFQQKDIREARETLKDIKDDYPTGVGGPKIYARYMQKQIDELKQEQGQNLGNPAALQHLAQQLSHAESKLEKAQLDVERVEHAQSILKTIPKSLAKAEQTLKDIGEDYPLGTKGPYYEVRMLQNRLKDLESDRKYYPTEEQYRVAHKHLMKQLHTAQKKQGQVEKALRTLGETEW